MIFNYFIKNLIFADKISIKKGVLFIFFDLSFFTAFL